MYIFLKRQERKNEQVKEARARYKKDKCRIQGIYRSYGNERAKRKSDSRWPWEGIND